MSKKSNPLLWVAVGCGALVLVGIVVVVALGGFAFFTAKKAVEEFGDNPAQVIAEMAVRADPNLELVSSDPERGVMTVKNLQEEKEYEISFEDLAEGRVSWQVDGEEYSFDAGATEEGGGQMVVTGPEGNTTTFGATESLENVPDWVPVYPNATETNSSFSMATDTESSGILVSASDDSLDQVAGYYESTAEEMGYTVSKTTFSTNGQNMVSLSCEDSDGRTLQITNATDDQGKVQTTIQYNGKN